MAKVIKTFDGLNPVAPEGGEETAKANSPSWGGSVSIVTVRSKVKSGRQVSMEMSRNMTSRRPLNTEEIALVEGIYKDIPSLKMSSDITLAALFPSFVITLDKKDCFVTRENKKKKGHGGVPSNQEMDEKTFGNYKRKEEKEGKKKKETEGERKPTVDDIAGSVVMDENAKKVQKKYWLPALRKMYVNVMLYGLSPFYLITKDIEMPFYSRERVEEKGEGERPFEHDSDDLNDSDEISRNYDSSEDSFEFELRMQMREPEKNYRDESEPLYVSRYSAEETAKRFKKNASGTVYSVLEEDMTSEFYDFNNGGKEAHQVERMMKNLLNNHDSMNTFVNNDNDDDGYGRDNNHEDGTNYSILEGDRMKAVKAKDLSDGGAKSKKSSARILRQKLGDVNPDVEYRNAPELFGVDIPTEEYDNKKLKVPNMGTVVHSDLPDAASWTQRLDDMKNEETNGPMEQVGGGSAVSQITVPGSMIGNSKESDVSKNNAEVTRAATASEKKVNKNSEKVGGKRKKSSKTKMILTDKKDLYSEPLLKSANSVNDATQTSVTVLKTKISDHARGSASSDYDGDENSSNNDDNNSSSSSNSSSDSDGADDLTFGSVRRKSTKKRKRRLEVAGEDRVGPLKKKRRRKIIKEDEDNGVTNSPKYKLVKRTVKVKHDIPVVPSFELGTVETYNDLDGQKYVWTWKNTKDEYDGKIEPYMMFVVGYAPSIMGSLNSQVSTMIPDYKEYLGALKRQEEYVKESRYPFFAVTKSEKKIPVKGSNFLENSYIPTMTAGYSGPFGYGLGGDGGVAAFDYNTGTVYPASRRWTDPNHPNGIVPTGWLGSDGYGAVPSWSNGYLHDPSSGMGGGPGANVQYANYLNGLSGDDRDARMEYASRMENEVRRRRARMEETVAASDGILGAQDPGYFPSMERRRMEAASASASLNRPVVSTNVGCFIFLEEGETVTEIKKVDAPSKEAVSEPRRRLDSMAGALGGYPLSTVYNPSAQKGPDGSFTTKSQGTGANTNSSAFGLNTSHTMMSPTKDFVNEFRSEKRAFFSEVVKEIFIMAYSEAFKRKDKFWKKVLENTFEKNPNVKLGGRYARGGGNVGGKSNNLPSFESFFDITVDFPSSSNNDLDKALDYYKFGFYDSSDVFNCMLTSGIGSSIPEKYVRIISKGSEDKIQNAEEIKKRVDSSLKDALEYEKKKGQKEQEGAKSKLKPKSKLKSKSKAKAKSKTKTLKKK